MQTIMIVDDDPVIGDLEQEILTQAGYAVRRAYSGTEALLLWRDGHPGLVLLDLMLPGLSGEALLPKLRTVPVIVVSAKTEAKDTVSPKMVDSISSRQRTCAGRRVWPVSTTNARIDRFDPRSDGGKKG